MGERVDDVGLNRVGAEGQVQHADVHPVAVRVLHDPVDACDDLRDIRATNRVADLDVDDAGVGRDALVGTGRRRGGDDPAIRPAMNVPWPFRSR